MEMALPVLNALLTTLWSKKDAFTAPIGLISVKSVTIKDKDVFDALTTIFLQSKDKNANPALIISKNAPNVNSMKGNKSNAKSAITDSLYLIEFANDAIQ